MKPDMLERLLAVLDPAVSTDRRGALHRASARLEAAGFALIGGDRDGGLLHLVFADGVHRLRFAAPELEALAGGGDDALDVPRLLRLHGQRGPVA
jgi:hypothetical protein